MQSFDLSRLPEKWVVKQCNDPRWQIVIDVMNSISDLNWKGDNRTYPYYGVVPGSACCNRGGVNYFKNAPYNVTLLSIDEFCELIQLKSEINGTYNIF